MIHRMDPPVDPDREPMPERLQPMLARAGHCRRDTERALGLRGQVGRHPRDRLGSRAAACACESRNGNDITARYPELRELGRALGARPADPRRRDRGLRRRGPAELRAPAVAHAPGQRGRGAPRRARHAGRLRALRRALPGRAHDCSRCPTRSAAPLLEELALRGPHWQTPGYRTKDAEALLRVSAERGLEGVVAKRLRLALRARAARRPVGSRSRTSATSRVVIGGWLPGEGRAQHDDRRAARGLPGEDGDARLRRARGHRLHRAHAARAAGAAGAAARRRVAVHRPQAAAAEAPVWVRAEARGRGRVRRVDAHAHAAGAVVQGPARRHRPARGSTREEEESDDVAALERRAAAQAIDAAARAARRRARRGRDRAAARCRSRTWTRSCTRRPGSPRARSSTTTRASRPIVLPHLRDRPADPQALPQRRRRRVLLREAVARRTARPGCRPRRSGAATTSARSSTRWPRTCPRSCGWPTWPTSSCTPRCRWPPTSTQPTMLVFDLDPGAPAAVAGVRAGGAVGARPVRAARPGDVREDIGLQGPAGLRPAERRRDLRPDQAVRPGRGRSCWRSSTPSSWSRAWPRSGARARCSSTGARTTSTRRRSTCTRCERASARRSRRRWNGRRSSRRWRPGTPTRSCSTSDDVLDRVQRLGDLFAPVLEREQQLPALSG